MQIVAKFQFSAPTNDQVVADQIAEVIREWGRTKFEQDAAGSTLIRRSGVAAIFDTQRQISGSSTETTFNVLEPVSGGQLQTQIRILETASRAHVRCTLSLRSDGGVLLPYVAIRSPKFICDIIKLDKQWQVAEEAERIFAKCFGVRSKEEVETLWRLITATQRRLPVIVVSELQGETLGNDIHELISTDVCAIAHTCRLSTESSWDLTNVCGKEWSCYNGAIRLYWPFRLNRDDYRVHPLWTRDFLMRGTDEEKFARDRFRMELAQRLIEASTFTPDNPAFANFEAERVRSAREAERAKAAGDFKVLAESYATENDDLRAALATSNNELETLRQNIESLMLVLRSRERVDVDHAGAEIPPETVASAVTIARNKLGDTVAFADNIDEQVATLKSSAGPPDKILRYLLTLGELAEALQRGPSLGQSIPIWLREKSVECSVDSETVRVSNTSRALRTFAIGGEHCYCDFHLKPSDGVAPDLCVRIYLAVELTPPRVRVGYIGRHFD